MPSHDSSESKPETHKHIIIMYKSQLQNLNALDTKIKSSYKQIYASQYDTKKYKRELNIFETWSIKYKCSRYLIFNNVIIIIIKRTVKKLFIKYIKSNNISCKLVSNTYGIAINKI